VCAVAYVMVLDRIERRCDAFTQAAAVSRAMGGEAEIPDFDEIRDKFDRWLCEQPAELDPDDAALREALGLSAGR